MPSVLSNFNERSFCSMRREYLEDIKNWRNAQMEVLRQWKPLTEHDQKKWFELISTDDKQIIFAILGPSLPGSKEASGGLIGYCGITNLDTKNRRGEISFLVDPERVKDEKIYRDDFLSALYMLCRYAFESIDLNKLFTETYVFREYHIGILEEFGLKADSILRQHEFINGKFYDSVIHSILCDEWPGVKERIDNEPGK